jgi:hypothetical protein
MIGQLIQAGGSLLGGLIGGDGGAGDAFAMNQALVRKILEGYREQSVRNELAYREARQLYGERTDQVLADIGRAEAQLQGSSREAQRGVAARGAQTQGAVTQNLTSRGLGNSTIAANAQRGIASDVSRGIAGIQQQEGAGLANLNMQRAGVRAGLLGDQAELPIRQFQSGYGVARDRLGYLGDLTYQGNQGPGLGSQLGGAIGGIPGGLLARLFGGGNQTPGFSGGMFDY